MYLKRNKIGKSWPVARKGTKYLAVSSHNQSSSIPLIVVMREVLDLVKTKKELKKIINEKKVMVNGKKIKKTNYPIGLFDVISINILNKNFRSSLDNRKIVFEEISDKQAETKTIKIMGKKILGKDKIQLNLSDGRNILTKEKADVGDSVVFNFKQNKIEKIIKMEKGKKGFVVKGKHIGVKGKIEDIIERGGKKIAEIKDDKKINVWIKNVIVME